MFTLVILACLSADDDEDTSFAPASTFQQDWWTLSEDTYAERVRKEKARKAWAKLQRFEQAAEESYARKQRIAYNKAQAYWRQEENDARIMYALNMGIANQRALANETFSTCNASLGSASSMSQYYPPTPPDCSARRGPVTGRRPRN